ncbi:MAG: 4-(cytidine 5'-diphospho)-2-C-methyl-D-erythritol kinase [Treponema sp.]
MLTEISVSAPAKINIGLKVLPVREDGFHSIESIFQTVDLCDELKVRVIGGAGQCEVICADTVLPENNTLTSAYRAFSEAAGKSLSVSVELKKQIPSGGGLGGGSSDAAALVRALEKLNGATLSEKELDSIAAKVGSDVFFFLHAKEKGAAIVTGRGEKIRCIRRREDLTFVLVFPEVSSSTKEAYALIDALYAVDRRREIFPDVSRLEEMYNGAVENWTFKNSFCAPLKKKYTEIGEAFAALSKVNAPYYEMTGSGSTLFGVFTDGRQAFAAVQKLRARGFRCVTAH